MNMPWKSKLNKLRLYHFLTYTHSINVANLSQLISKEMDLPLNQRKKIYMGACLHDIGKLMIPLYVLNKSSSLSYTEWQLMKRHTLLGTETIAKDHIDISSDVLDIINLHHERWDGKGYLGLAGEQIPLSARIIAIADAVDAMSQNRPYQSKKTVEQCIEEVMINSGTQFDPVLAGVMTKILGIYNDMNITSIIERDIV